jgi:mRNA interferase MazF
MRSAFYRFKLVAPLTDWKASFSPNVWHVRVDPDANNGLSKPSAVDVLQLRGMDTQRFVQRLGKVPADNMEEIVLAIGAAIEYP